MSGSARPGGGVPADPPARRARLPTVLSRGAARLAGRLSSGSRRPGGLQPDQLRGRRHSSAIARRRRVRQLQPGMGHLRGAPQRRARPRDGIRWWSASAVNRTVVAHGRAPRHRHFALVGCVAGVLAIAAGLAVGGTVGSAFVGLGSCCPPCCCRTPGGSRSSPRGRGVALSSTTPSGRSRSSRPCSSPWRRRACSPSSSRGRSRGGRGSGGLVAVTGRAVACGRAGLVAGAPRSRRAVHGGERLPERCAATACSVSGRSPGSLRSARYAVGNCSSGRSSPCSWASTWSRSRRQPRWCARPRGACRCSAWWWAGCSGSRAGIWGLGLLFVLPDEAGEYLLGDVWPAAAALIVPATLGVMNAGLSAGPSAGLRALGAARLGLRAQMIISVMYASFGVAGAALGGALDRAGASRSRRDRRRPVVGRSSGSACGGTSPSWTTRPACCRWSPGTARTSRRRGHPQRARRRRHGGDPAARRARQEARGEPAPLDQVPEVRARPRPLGDDARSPTVIRPA